MLHSNRAVALGLAVLNYRGWQSSGGASFSLAPLMDRLGTHRWTAGTFVLDFSPTLASRYVILLCVLFGGMMLGDLDGLLAAYKFSSAGLVSQVRGQTFPHTQAVPMGADLSGLRAIGAVGGADLHRHGLHTRLDRAST